MKCFNKLVEPVVNARREGDENPISGVVAETMKKIANSPYGYHIVDRSPYTVTNYLSDEKTCEALNNKVPGLFKRSIVCGGACQVTKNRWLLVFLFCN